MHRLVLILITFISIALPALAGAQTAVSPAQDQPSDSPISAPIQEKSQLTLAEERYFSLLENYRQQEQTYLVAKNQFLQLNTLAAQEVAIKETKAALELRAEVLQQYLDILIMLLQQTNGIPLEEKNPQLVNLSLLRDELLLHKNAVSAATDRVSVDQEADRFAPIFTSLSRNVYYTLSLVRIGRVQTAIDKLSVVRNAVGQDLDSRNLTSSQQAEKQRGLQEIDRTQQSIALEFAPIAQTTYSRKADSSLQTLTNLSTSLSKTFTLIYQNVRFLQEIRQ